MLASMLVPLPAVMLDFLLATNLLFALVLLGVSVVLQTPLQLSTLPSILLMGTLFRLSLNISTTRLILSGEDPGEMVMTFGKVMTHGNLAVGLIAFLIVTIVQFIVIAKGSERVAEVAARFALDAMPGRQMSIDADLRSGLLDVETARQKRLDLQVESRFFGALDGAMKFVKGDAIAGICITVLNIFGGFALGVLVYDISAAEALRKFALLSIGDGLLSQIPAFLQAVAAGLVVTRVTREDEQSLSEELTEQVFRSKSLFGILAPLCAMLAFVPGLPSFPFVCAAFLFLFISLQRKTHAREDVQEQRFTPRHPALYTVHLSHDVLQSLPDPFRLASVFTDFQERIYEGYGLILPSPVLEIFKAKEGHVAVDFREQRIFEKEEQDGRPLEEILKAVLFAHAISHTKEICDDMHTRRWFDSMEQVAPELASSLVPQKLSITKCTLVFRSLLEEGFRLSPGSEILQAIAEHLEGERKEEHSVVVLAEKIRERLAQAILQALAQTQEGSLPVSYLGPETERFLAEFQQASQVFARQHFFRWLLGELEKKSEATLLVCSRLNRRAVFEGLRSLGREQKVFSYEEVLQYPHVESQGIFAYEQKGEEDGEADSMRQTGSLRLAA